MKIAVQRVSQGIESREVNFLKDQITNLENIITDLQSQNRYLKDKEKRSKQKRT